MTSLPGPRQPAPGPDPAPRPGSTAPRQSELVDWAEGLAHEVLIGVTVDHLREAREAALRAEAATVQLGYVTLARDLVRGRQ
ncbi:hypothetical protein ACFWA1_35845 [Streptomyces sp. NPDC060005]|uniref:hypothetical protein n=1 Tax=Streptomyces sp. NPDC060005 TaxID=3347034 RepID=UPI0036B0EA1E